MKTMLVTITDTVIIQKQIIIEVPSDYSEEQTINYAQDKLSRIKNQKEQIEKINSNTIVRELYC